VQARVSDAGGVLLLRVRPGAAISEVGAVQRLPSRPSRSGYRSPGRLSRRRVHARAAGDDRAGRFAGRAVFHVR